MSQNRADVLLSKCFESHERLVLFSNNCVYMSGMWGCITGECVGKKGVLDGLSLTIKEVMLRL